MHCWKTGCRPGGPHCSGKDANRSFRIFIGQPANFYRLPPAAALSIWARSRNRGGRDRHTVLALPRQKRELTEDPASTFLSGHRRSKALVVQGRETTGSIPQPTASSSGLRRCRRTGHFWLTLGFQSWLCSAFCVGERQCRKRCELNLAMWMPGMFSCRGKGGTITVASQAGSGCDFAFSLPIAIGGAYRQ